MTLAPTKKNYLLKLLRQRNRDKIPPILYPLWQPYSMKMIHGGRGSAKSETVGRINIRQASNYKLKVVWGRYIQESIEESVHEMLGELIEELKYPGWNVLEKKIINKKTGSRFVFKGFKDKKASGSVKSYSRFDRLIVEEAQQVPTEAWIDAVPTFRNKGAEVWAIFNRYEDLDPVYQLYCIGSGFRTIFENGYSYQTDGDILVIECNYTDNPWFPEVLRKQMLKMREDDYDLYLHVWENHPIAQLEKALMDRTLVDIAMKTILPPDGPQVLGVDIARHGMDKSRAYETRGRKSLKIGEAKHTAPIKFANEMAHKADNPYIMINVDNGGLGAGGFIDRLIELGFKNVNGINFNGTPKDKKKYANAITEMYFEAKEKMIYADIPDDILLKQDLTGRLFGYDNQTRKILEKKEKFRERYKRSPDDGDALVLSKYDPGKRIKMKEDEILKRKEKVRIKKARKRRRLSFF